MGLPRSRYVREGEEGVYHCMSRCVRRAFLCGFDKQTRRDFSHRKALLLEKMRFLATVFAIEVCAYAILATHYHSILRTRPDIVAQWSDREVAIRWLTLFRGKRGRRRCGEGAPSEEDIRALTDDPGRIEELRNNLCSISWFMGRLNESIARTANKEDGVTGRFWEGRFKCNVLLDEAAIASCMVYVDLNPIRAGLAETPEESDFASIQERIRGWQQGNRKTECDSGEAAVTRRIAAEPSAQSCTWLCPIESEPGRRGILEMSAGEYFDLVDKSGRMKRADKRGSIDGGIAPILMRIGVKPDTWLDTVTQFGSRFRIAAGSESSLRSFADRIGRRWVQGANAARVAFCSAEP